MRVAVVWFKAATLLRRYNQIKWLSQGSNPVALLALKMLSVKSVCCKPGSRNEYVGSNPTPFHFKYNIITKEKD
jgi:hypothetical protein